MSHQLRRDTSSYSGAHDFNIQGGQHEVMGGNAYHSYYAPVQYGSQSHQISNAQGFIQNRDSSRSQDTSRSGALLPIPDISRIIRIFSTEVVDLMTLTLERIQSLESSGSSPRDAEIYLRLMLQHRHGYPLYRPEPSRGLPMDYRIKGVRIGDVGAITPDGTFDFLFNVDESVASRINPPSLPEDFEMLQGIVTLSNSYIQPRNHLLSDEVEQTMEVPISYRFSSSEGAVLQLPQGADIFQAQNTSELKDLASRHAGNWYRYLVANRSRDIPNGVLYVVTGCIKCSHWGIGTSYGRPAKSSDHLQFRFDDQPVRRLTSFRTSGHVIAKIGPEPIDMLAEEEPNQCVFIRGFKITLAGMRWKQMTARQKSSQGKTRLNLSTSADVNPTSDDRNVSPAAGPTPTFPISGSSNTQFALDSLDPGRADTDIIVEELCRMAPPIHPSDFINALLLLEVPEAKAAITHDNEWLDLLPHNFAIDQSKPKIRELLQNIVNTYTITIDGYGCVSLTKSPLESSLASRSNYDNSLAQNAKTQDASGVSIGDPIPDPLSPPQTLETSTPTVVTPATQEGETIATSQFNANYGAPTFVSSGGSRRSRMYLNNFVGRRHLGRIEYVDSFIHDGAPTWVSTIHLNEACLGEGKASTKSDAREIAADQALDHLWAQYGK